MLAQEFFDLRERLWMRARGLYVFQARAGHCEEAVAHTKDELGDDLGAVVLPQKVIDVRDRTRVRVLDRDDRGVDLVRLEGGEDLREGAARQEAGPRKERRRGRLRECPSKTLVGDVRQRYTAVRHSGCPLSSPWARPK